MFSRLRNVTVLVVVLAMSVMVLVSVSLAQDDMEDIPLAIEFMHQAYNGGSIEGFEEYIHPDWTWSGNGEVQYEGYEGFQATVAFFNTAFPDLKTETVDIVGVGDRWAILWHITGTQTGDFEPAGLVATGKELDYYVSGFIYLEDGMVKDCVLTWDWITWFDVLNMPYGPSVEGEAG